jgi:hypothetical protein
MDQLLGAIREIVIAVIGGLLSSLIFVYFQRASERRAIARLEGLSTVGHVPVPERQVRAPETAPPRRRGRFGYAMKHALWFLASLALVTFSGIVFWAFADTFTHGAYTSRHLAEPGFNPSWSLLFLYTIPLFVMSLGAQYADRFIAVWWKFILVGIVGIVLMAIAIVILCGPVDGTGRGIFGWPDAKIAEGFFVGLMLLYELFLTILAGSHWPHWRIFGETA